MTLGIIRMDNQVLLGMKKRGFGEGLWNGFGGKVKEGEDIVSSLIREFQEEVSLVPKNPECVGRLDFVFKEKGETCEVHIFSISEFVGDPCESEEMRPEWFYLDEIPFPNMWKDDPHWFPLFLQGKKFAGEVEFSPENEIKRVDIKEVDAL